MLKLKYIILFCPVGAVILMPTETKKNQWMKDAGLQQTRVGESSVVGDSNSIFLKWKQNFEIM